MQENILNIIDIYKEIFDTEYYKLYKGDDATHLLYEGYCFYFAKLLYDTFPESIMCKNPSGDHYFVKIYDEYYDARDNYDERGKRCPIKKDNCGNIKDLDGTFIKPIEISIAEDPLRILRAFRFKEQYNLTFVGNEEEILFKHKDLLNKINKQKILEERSKYKKVGGKKYDELFK